MGFFSNKKRDDRKEHSFAVKKLRSFFTTEVNERLFGWTTSTSSIDAYLKTDLQNLRARSRELYRQNGFAKKFVALCKTNIVGPEGIMINSRLRKRNGELDMRANEAIEYVLKDWMKPKNCDYRGTKSFKQILNLDINSNALDGEGLIEFREGPQYGKYGFQIVNLDAELIDLDKNERLHNGNQVRLGVEYDPEGIKRVAYHLKSVDINGNYTREKTRRVDADNLLVGHLEEFNDASHGLPWMHPVLEDLKSLGKYKDAALDAARNGAHKVGGITQETARNGDQPAFTGDYQEDGQGYVDSESGQILDLGTKKFSTYDPSYPHEMYSPYIDKSIQGISSGLLVAHASLSNNLADVNFSSIRTGVLDQRDIFKMMQSWYIETKVVPIIERLIRWLVMSKQIKLLTTGNSLSRPYTDYQEAIEYRGRRWEWVDPKNDSQTAEIHRANNWKSSKRIMQEMGITDPESEWEQIKKEDEELGDDEQITETDGKATDKNGEPNSS